MGLKRCNNVTTSELSNAEFRHSINYQFQHTKDKAGHNLAAYTAENYMSALNHQMRSDRHSFSAAEKADREKSQLNFIGARKKDQLQETMVSSILHGNKSGCRDQRTLSVQLKGPYHPLQFNIVSSHRIGSTKKANIEPDSVNSVLMDKSAKDRHDVWLVAGHVGSNSAGDSLILRSTTLMPNKMGLGVFLSMAFSPTVEMRYDSKRREYTGCLLGLGSRKHGLKTQKHLSSKSNGTSAGTDHWNYSLNDTSEHVPYHPEHDMEIQFDVNIDNSDINLINQLRYRMSIALTRINARREDGTLLPVEQRMREIPARLTITNHLIEDQDKIQNLVNHLMMRPRKVVNKKHFKNEYHWRQLPAPDKLYHPHIVNEDELLLKMITQVTFPT